MEAGFRERADDGDRRCSAHRTTRVTCSSPSPHRDTVDEAVWFAEQLVEQGIGGEALAPTSWSSTGCTRRSAPGTAADAPSAGDDAARHDGDVARACGRNLAELRAARRTRAGGRSRRSARSLGWDRVVDVPLLVATSTTSPGSAQIAGTSRSDTDRLTSPGVHILLATDADWLVDDVVAALGDRDTSFTVCRDGRDVAGQVAASATPRPRHPRPADRLDGRDGGHDGAAPRRVRRHAAARPGPDAARPRAPTSTSPPERRRRLADQAARPAAPAARRRRRRRGRHATPRASDADAAAVRR